MLNLTAQATSHKPQATSHKPLDNIVAQVPVQGTLFHPSALLILLALLGWHRTTLADPVSAVPSTTAATEKAPSDQFDWTGDTIILHTDFPGIKRHGDKDKVDYCAPAKSTWLINHEDKATYKLTAMLQLDSSWTTMLNAISPQDKDSPKPKICVNDPTQPLPNKQIAYELDKAEIELVPHSQRGCDIRCSARAIQISTFRSVIE